jgi:hypothetical protein
MLLEFSFLSALFHGWDRPAFALLTIAVLMVGIARIMTSSVGWRRLQHRIESEMREVGKDVYGEAPFQREVFMLLRDDGGRLVVYPSRRRLLGPRALQLLLLGGIGACFVFLHVDDVRLLGALGLSAGLLLVVAGATLFRLVRRRPTLVVGPEGHCGRWQSDGDGHGATALARDPERQGGVCSTRMGHSAGPAEHSGGGCPTHP